MQITKNTENYIEWKQKGKIDLDCRAWKEDKISATLNCGGDKGINE